MVEEALSVVNWRIQHYFFNVVIGVRMKFKRCEVLVAITIVLVGFTGCDFSGNAKVSGKVTFKGEPVENVRVIFTPVGGRENLNSGPYSTGVTDAEGKFYLKTRDGEQGAVAGKHKVGFGWADIEFDEIQSYQDMVEQADQGSEELATLQAQLDDLKSRMASRPKVRFGVFETDILKLEQTRPISNYRIEVSLTERDLPRFQQKRPGARIRNRPLLWRHQI